MEVRPSVTPLQSPDLGRAWANVPVRDNNGPVPCRSESALSCLVELDHDPNFWPIYRHTVLNGILFALLERRSVPRYPELRKILLTPNWSRRESAILALDARFYEQANCHLLPRVQEEADSVPAEDFTATIEIIITHISSGKWWEDLKAEGDPIIDDPLFHS